MKNLLPEIDTDPDDVIASGSELIVYIDDWFLLFCTGIIILIATVAH